MVLEGPGSYLKPMTLEGVTRRFRVVVFTLALPVVGEISVTLNHLLNHTHAQTVVLLHSHSSVCALAWGLVHLYLPSLHGLGQHDHYGNSLVPHHLPEVVHSPRNRSCASHWTYQFNEQHNE